MTRQDDDMTLRGSAVPTRATVEEAARLLGVSVDAIRKRIERGTLESEKVSGTRYVFIDHAHTLGPDTNMAGHDSDMTRQDSGQDDDRTRHDSDMTGLLASMQDQIDLLKQELEDRKDEARRKDAILLTLAQRVPELEAAPESREFPQTPSEPQGNGAVHPEDGGAEKRSWWRQFFGIQ